MKRRRQRTRAGRPERLERIARRGLRKHGWISVGHVALVRELDGMWINDNGARVPVVCGHDETVIVHWGRGMSESARNRFRSRVTVSAPFDWQPVVDGRRVGLRLCDIADLRIHTAVFDAREGEEIALEILRGYGMHVDDMRVDVVREEAG